jgi:hypothetical protein
MVGLRVVISRFLPDQGHSRLKYSLRRVGCITCLALGMGAFSGAWAGGGINDEPQHSEDEGPSYFGFVKDARGVGIQGAKVTVKVKNGIAYVMHTDARGIYRIRGLGKEINPADVMISCARDGYRQVRIFRRPIQRGKPVKAVETECRMDAGK